MIRSQDQEIRSLVDDIQGGKLLLPELQRSYVWKSNQVRDLFDSLYHQYPSGQLLVWETDDLPATRHVSIEGLKIGERHPQLLLDGQQRLTSLSTVMLGKPILVRNRVKPIDIVFNFFTEKFEVSGPRQRGQVGWVSLSRFFTKGAMTIFAELDQLDIAADERQRVFERITRLEAIRSYRYRVNVLEQLSYDEVTHIFVRINSGGTTLGSADLALAQMSSRWHGVTEAFDGFLKQLDRKELVLDHGFLLRVMVAVITGQSKFALLFRGEHQQLTVDDLKAGWKRAEVALKASIQFVLTNCDIDRLDLLPTHAVFVPLAAFFDRFGKNITDVQVRDLQRWVYMALIWSRYSASSETSLDQDIAALQKADPVQSMIQNIEDKVGHGRVVTERELQDQRKGSPYVLMAYVLARRAKAQDWYTGVQLGAGSGLESHHIFPKALLAKQYDLQKDSRTVDQVANLAFISGKANQQIGKRSPAEYFQEIEQARLQAQSVPLDPSILTLDKYEDFVRRRRQDLAEGINQLLLTLSGSSMFRLVPETEALSSRVRAAEDQLRALISQRLLAAQGASAWKRLVPSDIQTRAEERMAQVVRNNPFEEGRHNSLISKLSLCQFGDYLKIISANWVLFEDAFGTREKLGREMSAVTDARNALAHHRAMSTYERAAAEAGLLWLEQCLQAAQELEESDEEAAG